MRRLRGDDGQLTLLIIGFSVVAMLLVVVVVDVSVVYLARRDLVSAVDGAALRAAQEMDEAAYYTQGATDGIPVDADLAALAVERLARHYPDTRFSRPVLLDRGRAVRVAGSRRIRLPMARLFGVDEVTVTAESTARVPLR